MTEKKKRKGGREVPASRGAIPPSEFTLADATKLLVRLENQIKVIHGVNDDTFDGLVGQIVSSVRDALGDAFSIPPESISLVNGQPVDGDYVLKSNDTLEFIRPRGVRLTCTVPGAADAGMTMPSSR